MKELPKINTEYPYFDDGKIRQNRKDTAIINEIIPFNDIDLSTLDEWKEEVDSCDWLYAADTDYFIKAHLQNTKEDIIFVRCNNGGWFSLGFWGGRLDIDGSLLKKLLKID